MAKKAENKKNNEEEKPASDALGILPVDIGAEMKESYLDYAMSVITQRALPDIRDGLKPVHRRILFSMHEMGLVSSAKFRKSAAVVGDVLGKYHPHGDASVYDAMVKMAQVFSFRYPIVLGQGNFGSIDGDSPAAMRYTEAKMAKISAELLRDLEKETVDFRPNYDGTRKEPIVLPAAVPNLLLNGTLGIAVGMATNIPPHNLVEVVDATKHLIDNKDATTDDLLQFVKGPDFPTGGLIYGAKDMNHAYASGRGGVMCRGEAEIIETKSGTFEIIVTSIPYRVNKADLIMHIADLVREKKLEGVKALRDESTRDIRIVIELKGGISPQQVLNYLYKHSELETMFHFNVVGLVEGVPQTLSLKTILSEFIAHRQIVVRRRSEFDLRRALEREHILLGLTKALDNIDAVIKTIKASKDTSEARINLMKKFKFSELQANAILDMKLQKLAGLERKKIEEELKEVQGIIKFLKDLLGSTKKILNVIKDELTEISAKHGDARRTKVIKSIPKEITAEDLVADEDSMLVFTKGGYVKRTNPDEYRRQKRGGVGVMDLNTKEEDFITNFLTTSTHSDLLFFTDKGKAYQMKMFEIAEGRRATRGKSVMNYLSLTSGENVSSILALPKEMKAQEAMSLIMVTKQGVIKKMAAESFKDVRRSGLIAIKLQGNDELLASFLVEKGDTIVLVTAGGQSVRFKESDVREMGRVAQGVKATRLKKGDTLVSGDVVKKSAENATLLVMSGNGYGKQTSLKEYKVQKRGGSGIKTMAVTAKTGKLMTAKVVTEEEELIVISKFSQVIRVDLKEIPKLGRQTQGVRVMKMREGDSLASAVCL